MDRAKKISRLYRSEEYKAFEQMVNEEMLEMVQRPNILNLFGAVSNYFVMVGMKRILQRAEQLDKDYQRSVK